MSRFGIADPRSAAGREAARVATQYTMIRGVALSILIAVAAPAWAAAGPSAVPEPGAIMLFVGGVAGLLFGRRAGRKGPDDRA